MKIYLFPSWWLMKLIARLLGRPSTEWKPFVVQLKCTPGVGQIRPNSPSYEFTEKENNQTVPHVLENGVTSLLRLSTCPRGAFGMHEPPWSSKSHQTMSDGIFRESQLTKQRFKFGRSRSVYVHTHTNTITKVILHSIFSSSSPS